MADEVNSAMYVMMIIIFSNIVYVDLYGGRLTLARRFS